MKTFYMLDCSDLAFTSWEDCMKFMKMCNANPDKYGAIDKSDFIECHFWEEEK